MRICLGLVLAVLAWVSPAAVDCQRYPHWDGNHGVAACDSSHPPKALVALEAYIARHQSGANGHHDIAAFDWDGTLFNEKIRLHDQDARSDYAAIKGSRWGGECVAYLWMAERDQLPSYQHHGVAFVNRLLYTEGRSNAPVGDYSKFSQSASYLSGLSCPQFIRQVNAYAHAYPIRGEVFLPMIDVANRLHQAGFPIWIVTGSNPYFVAPILAKLQRDNGVDLGIIPRAVHRPNELCAAIASGEVHIVGNTTYLDRQQRFTTIYDRDYVDGRLKPGGPLSIDTDRQVVEKRGKALAISRYIEAKGGAAVSFYAGNSLGDLSAIRMLLDRPSRAGAGRFVNPLVLAVHPNHERSFAPLQAMIDSKDYPSLFPVAILWPSPDGV